MNFDFEKILFYIVLTCGLIALLDILFLARKRKNDPAKKMPIWVEHARSFFPVLFIVFCIRSFAYEGFRIPSGSLKPTLLVGDFILVNKYAYGFRLPVIHTKIASMSKPQRGDIVVFREVPTESRNLIKRVIGIPGDHVVYKDKTLFINGVEASQQFENYSTDQDDGSESWQVEVKQENLLGIKHGIYLIPSKGDDDFDVIVPEGHYFMMGDNRDDSGDSRYWGFLQDKNIIGKATHVVVSFDDWKHPVRWERTGWKII